MHTIEKSEAKSLHSNPIEEFLIRLILAAAGIILIGYIFFQSAIFSTHSNKFQFVEMSFIGGAFYLFLMFFSKRNALAAYFVLCFFLHVFIPVPNTLAYIARNIMYFTAVGIAIYVFWKYPFTGNHARITRPLQLAGLLAISAIPDTIILTLIMNSWGAFWYWLYIKCALMCLIGLGLGIGIEAGEKIYHFYFEHNYGEG